MTFISRYPNLEKELKDMALSTKPQPPKAIPVEVPNLEFDFDKAKVNTKIWNLDLESEFLMIG